MSYELVKKAQPSLCDYAPCKHRDCVYRAKKGGLHQCDYITITGRSRIAQHDPRHDSPAECELYRSEKGLKNLLKEIKNGK